MLAEPSSHGIRCFVHVSTNPIISVFSRSHDVDILVTRRKEKQSNELLRMSDWNPNRKLDGLIRPGILTDTAQHVAPL